MMALNMQFPVELPKHILEQAKACGFLVEEVREEFIKGHGHGGQKVNKTSNCVFLQHIPTSLHVKCQEHREQHRNRIEAWILLIEKVAQHLADQKKALEHEEYVRKQRKRRRSRSSQRKVFEEKKRRGKVKRLRKEVDDVS